ncbi:hypothetical protein Silverhawkium_gp119 [Shigella phage Silverhawkium]|uniref:Uncharacterized protein n=2 Tax=Mooglevirus TaxID=1985303 RepID=A0A482JGY9_9CAUD|nr:hypothetical protein CHB7_gp121 [Enterobacteria phage CHB7]QBP33205.1 hypothetical protein Silverhawkium_gp119 [Shigella phage Silverhawkium]
MLISGVALLVSIVALYKAYKALNKVNEITTKEVKINLVRGFLERLDGTQLQRLEMSFRFKAKTYQINDVLSGDFELINDYNVLLESLQVADLTDYYPVVAQEINKRKNS